MDPNTPMRLKEERKKQLPIREKEKQQPGTRDFISHCKQKWANSNHHKIVVNSGNC